MTNPFYDNTTNTFNLGATKHNTLNSIHNLMKQNIPANLRLFTKSIFHPTNINENNFTADELGVLKDAYNNAPYRYNSPDAINAEYDYNEYRKMPKNSKVSGPVIGLGGSPEDKVPVSIAMDAAQRVFSRGLQYDDYQANGEQIPFFSGNNLNEMVNNSKNNKAYSMATAIGRANYYTDKLGNVHIKDTYNFAPKAPSLEWSNDYSSLHRLGERFGKSMPVDINLGKI